MKGYISNPVLIYYICSVFFCKKTSKQRLSNEHLVSKTLSDVFGKRPPFIRHHIFLGSVAIATNEFNG